MLFKFITENENENNDDMADSDKSYLNSNNFTEFRSPLLIKDNKDINSSLESDIITLGPSHKKIKLHQISTASKSAFTDDEQTSTVTTLSDPFPENNNQLQSNTL